MIVIDLHRFCRKIGYTFTNISFLKQALTHCSAGSENNERYEFLGDSILSFVITQTLFMRYTKQNEGQLSRLRAFLVKGEMLAEIATEIELGDYLYLGQGELKTGGFRRASILADALEAVIAAVFLDGGLMAAHKLIMMLYKSRLEEEGCDSDDLKNSMKDDKTKLQEYLQKTKKPLPEYTLTKIAGEEHEQFFYIRCRVSGIKKTTLGHGINRRKAEQHAARLLLNDLLLNNKNA